MTDRPPPSTRYRLAERLGQGASGEVFVAQDLLLDREVALKALKPAAQEDEDTRERFLYEAQVTARLGHPGILPVHDLGVLPDGRWFYAMQRLAGRTLRSVLDGLRGGNEGVRQAFPLRRRLELFGRACLTVAYAHDQGVVHRDLKPENLLLGDYGEVYVADWGLARVTGFTGGRGRATRPGSLVGTLYYMSPEQVHGEPGSVGIAADVWSLGVILFELCTLGLPFTGESAVSVMFRIVSADPPPAPDVPEALRALWGEALRRTAGERPTARSLAERVAAFLDGVEERARREARARALCARAGDLAKAHRDAARVLEVEAAAVQAAREALRPGTPMAVREAVWLRTQRLAEARLEAERLFTRAIQAASQSLEEAESDAAHEHLAALYWQHAEAAARRKDAVGAEHFRTLAAEHDRGALARQLAAVGALVVVAPADARVRVVRQVPHGPLLRDEAVDGNDFSALESGTYIVEVEQPGRLPGRLPVRVASGETATVVVDLPPVFAGHEAFVVIPRGTYVIGGDPEAPSALPRQAVEVGPFLLGRHPVTVGAYCEFLNDLAEKEGLDAALARAPRSSDGSVCYLDVDREVARFSVPAVDADGDAWHPDWPALAINAEDADAYCAWRTAVTGVPHRLPTEVEWEVAARGVDERLHPWGDGFDPVLCHMAESREGPGLPVPVGSYPYDRSPFGACDLAGLIVEWTSTVAPNGDRIQRGAAATTPAAWCRAAARRTQRATWNTPQFGFRLWRSVSDR